VTIAFASFFKTRKRCSTLSLVALPYISAIRALLILMSLLDANSASKSRRSESAFHVGIVLGKWSGVREGWQSAADIALFICTSERVGLHGAAPTTHWAFRHSGAAFDSDNGDQRGTA
jgi:hypothetical protein